MKIKFFNKIVATYLVIVILLFATLTIIIFNNMSIRLQNEESQRSIQILDRIQEYMNQKYAMAGDLLSAIYSDPTLFSDLTYFIEHGYIKYTEYKLNNYSDNPGIYPVKNFDDYIADYLKANGDIYGIGINSILGDQSNFYYQEVIAGLIGYFYSDYPLPSDGPRASSLSIIPAHRPINLPGTALPDSTRVFSLVKNINDINSAKNVGKVIIEYNTQAIKKTYSSYASLSPVTSLVYIIGEDGDVLYDSEGKYYDKKFPYLDQLDSGANSVRLDEDCFVDYGYCYDPNLVIAVAIPKSELSKSLMESGRPIALIAVACIGIAIALTFTTMRRFSKRVQTVIDSMRDIHDGNLSVRMPTDGPDDEIRQISLSFNEMYDRLNDHIAKEYVYALKQKNSELKMLQAQINPHFLYNTLEAIRMKAVARGVKEISDMIYILAELFRRSVKDEMIIAIGEEIEHVRMYLELFNIKSNYKLSTEFDIDPAILEYGISKNMLQPIVENSIMHGLDIENDGCAIKIEGKKSGSDIVITIADNGHGIEDGVLGEIRRGLENFSILDNQPSIGLVNINERIKTIFGAGYELEIYSAAGAGTRTVVRIPQVSKEDLKKNV
jgi:two-component system sensor histidine kinase YesM